MPPSSRELARLTEKFRTWELQILFLLGGLGMFAHALDGASGNTWRNVVGFRYEYTTVNTSTPR